MTAKHPDLVPILYDWSVIDDHLLSPCLSLLNTVTDYNAWRVIAETGRQYGIWSKPTLLSTPAAQEDMVERYQLAARLRAGAYFTKTLLAALAKASVSTQQERITAKLEPLTPDAIFHLRAEATYRTVRHQLKFRTSK